MKITLLQTNIAWGDCAANCATAEDLMDQHPGSDLYILPEMWSTGFDTSANIRATATEGNALAWMLRMARSRNCAVAGTVAVLDNDEMRNRFYFARPDGTFACYDKHHLFRYGGEDKIFTAGKERVVTEWRGWRILLLTCYDLRFPVFARNRQDYDMTICVASWPDSRQEVWRTLLRARALENQCVVCGVNRIGNDQQCHYVGGSAVIDAYGRTLLELSEDEMAGTAITDLDSLHRFRRKFPVLEDADTFELT